MIASPFLAGAALAFWGWQSGHLIVGLALGIVLEAPRYFKLRLDLGTVEHSRIADLSTVGFVTLALQACYFAERFARRGNGRRRVV